MVKKHTPYHFAFTMIELIFAIVIIAIAIVALPIMTNATNKNIDEGIKQEAIFAASTELMGAMSGYWDERSMDDENESMFSRVIDISSDCNTTTHLRPGHIEQPFHRRCLDSNSSANLSQTTNNTIFSLDDAAHGWKNIITNSNASGYKDKYQSDLNVTRSNSEKTLTNTIRDATTQKIITRLRLISANIGEIDYYKRTMP